MVRRIPIVDLYKYLDYHVQLWALANDKFNDYLTPETCKSFIAVKAGQSPTEGTVEIDVSYLGSIYCRKYFDAEFYEYAPALIKRVCLVMKEKALDMSYYNFKMCVTVKQGRKKIQRVMHIHPGLH